MVVPTKHQLFMNELCEILAKPKEYIFDLALDNTLPLWIGLYDVYLIPKGYQLQYENDRIVYPSEFFFSYVEIKPDKEALIKMKAVNGPMFIVSELSCSNEKDESMILYNVPDECYGETSIIGINTSQLFAKTDAVEAWRNSGTPARGGKKKTATAGTQVSDTAPIPAVNATNHPCHAEELFIAVHCWQSLFEKGGETEKKLKKTDIKNWISEHYPNKSTAAIERIATVVTPSKK